MDWKRLRFVKITKQTNYFQYVCFLSEIFMLLYYLSEQHLANSYHATPSSVWNIGTNNFVWKFGKTRSVCKPRSSLEDVINFFLHINQVLFCNNKFLTKDVDAILGRGKLYFAILLKEFEEVVLGVISYILDFFSEKEWSFVVFFHANIYYIW